MISVSGQRSGAHSLLRSLRILIAPSIAAAPPVTQPRAWDQEKECGGWQLAALLRPVFTESLRAGGQHKRCTISEDRIYHVPGQVLAASIIRHHTRHQYNSSFLSATTTATDNFCEHT